MNIFLQEIRSNLKSLIVWSIGMLFMIGAGMGKYAGSQASGQSMNELISQMPKTLQSILDVGSLDLTKAIGYYGMLFLYLAIMAAIHASMLGAEIIAKEEKDRTSEFLYVKPISRRKIVTLKLLAVLANLVILNAVTWLASLIIVGYYSKGEAIREEINILMVAMFILQLIFLSVGAGIAGASKRPKSATSYTTAILLTTFILSIAIDMYDKIANLKYLTPFKYFDAKNLLNTKSFDPVYLFLSSAIIVVLLYLTYHQYEKKDLNV